MNLAEKLATFTEHWSPRTVAEFNGHDVMVVKLQGEFVWHKHDDTDDFFLVLKGTLDLQLRDRTVTLGPGEMFIVPGASSIGPSRGKKCIFSSSNPPAHPTPATAPPPSRANSRETGSRLCSRGRPVSLPTSWPAPATLSR